ncbi:MAG TPA: hypothetical protein VGT78_13875 [Rhizomicrobium sp.]|nr:hypothetical protein [Rhizomicrobium sp.]
MKFRLFAMSAAIVLSGGVALAGPEGDLLKAYGECAAIRDDPARLACFDSVSGRAKEAIAPPAEQAPSVSTAAPAAPPAPPVATSPPIAAPAPAPAEEESWFGRNVGSIFGTAPEQQTTPEKFGADQLPPPETSQATTPEPLDSISANVTDLAFTPFGKFIVFLDNGQIWRQLEGDADRAHFKKDPKDNKVTISRGALGSYNLTINDSSKVFKVTRVK